MSRASRPNPKDGWAAMAQEMTKLQERVRNLEKRTTTTIQPGIYADMVANDGAVGNEGEIRIDPLTNKPIWYSNGAWRMLDAFVGAEVTLSADWTMPGNGIMHVKTDVVRYDTSGFCISTVSPEGFTYYRFQIPVGMTGVYLATANCLTTNTATKPRIHFYEVLSTDILIGYATTNIQTSTDSDVNGAWVAWFNAGDIPYFGISGNTSVVVKKRSFDFIAHFTLTRLGLYDPGGLSNQ